MIKTHFQIKQIQRRLLQRQAGRAAPKVMLWPYLLVGVLVGIGGVAIMSLIIRTLIDVTLFKTRAVLLQSFDPLLLKRRQKQVLL